MRVNPPKSNKRQGKSKTANLKSIPSVALASPKIFDGHTGDEEPPLTALVDEFIWDMGEFQSKLHRPGRETLQGG